MCEARSDRQKYEPLFSESSSASDLMAVENPTNNYRNHHNQGNVVCA
jgi:hypothetical protein